MSRGGTCPHIEQHVRFDPNEEKDARCGGYEKDDVRPGQGIDHPETEGIRDRDQSCSLKSDHIAVGRPADEDGEAERVGGDRAVHHRLEGDSGGEKTGDQAGEKSDLQHPPGTGKSRRGDHGDDEEREDIDQVTLVNPGQIAARGHLIPGERHQQDEKRRHRQGKRRKG